MTSIPVYAVIPAFRVECLTTEFGKRFVDVTRDGILLPSGSLVVACTGENNGFNSFYAENKLGLRFSTPAFRSLVPFPHEVFSVIIPNSYDIPLGHLPFGTSPAVASPPGIAERELNTLPFLLTFKETVTQQLNQSVGRLVDAWLARGATQSSVGKIELIQEATLVEKRTIEFRLDVSLALMLDIVCLVTELVGLAIANTSNPMTRISIAGRRSQIDECH